MDGDDNQNKESIIQEFHERIPGRWPVLALHTLLAIVVAAVVVFGVRAIYRHDHPPIKPVLVSGKESTKALAAGSQKRPSGSSSSTAVSNSGTSLPNSGPGPVVEIFVGATLAAAGLHYLINLRRTVRET